jgi:hypothetical protein
MEKTALDGGAFDALHTSASTPSKHGPHIDRRPFRLVRSCALSRENSEKMLPFVAAILAVASYYVLSLVQEPVSEAFSTSAVRLNGSDQMPLSGEMLAAIVGAVIGAVLTVLATIFIERGKRRRGEKKDVSDYITQIADHLKGMANEFENGKIPHMDGRAFDGLVYGFKDVLEKKLPHGLNERLNHYLEDLVSLTLSATARSMRSQHDLVITRLFGCRNLEIGHQCIAKNQTRPGDDHGQA